MLQILLDLLGGKRIDEIDSNAQDFMNADYFFQYENIVLELKTLEKDLFSDEDFERNERLLDKWFADGTLNKVDIIPILCGRKGLPQSCLAEIIKLCSRTFQKIIEKANKQLKETKEKLGNEETQRIVMICNDGNFFLDHKNLFGLLCSILDRRKEIEIEGLVYFTVNQSSVIPDNDLDWSIWAPAYGDTATDDLHLFVNELGRKFHEFYCKEFNLPITEHREYPGFEEGVAAIQEMRYIPKEVIYPKSKK